MLNISSFPDVPSHPLSINFSTFALIFSLSFTIWLKVKNISSKTESKSIFAPNLLGLSLVMSAYSVLRKMSLNIDSILAYILTFLVNLLWHFLINTPPLKSRSNMLLYLWNKLRSWIEFWQSRTSKRVIASLAYNADFNVLSLVPHCFRIDKVDCWISRSRQFLYPLIPSLTRSALA